MSDGTYPQEVELAIHVLRDTKASDRVRLLVFDIYNEWDGHLTIKFDDKTSAPILIEEVDRLRVLYKVKGNLATVKEIQRMFSLVCTMGAAKDFVENRLFVPTLFWSKSTGLRAPRE